jgi:hypothetical protein
MVVTCDNVLAKRSTVQTDISQSNLGITKTVAPNGGYIISLAESAEPSGEVIVIVDQRLGLGVLGVEERRIMGWHIEPDADGYGS